MKKLTKLLGIVLMVALVMSMGTMALAADDDTPATTVTPAINRNTETDGSVEIANPSVGQTYTLYKLFDADMGANDAITYTLPEGKTASDLVYTDGEGATHQWFELNSNGFVVASSGTDTDWAKDPNAILWAKSFGATVGSQITAAEGSAVKWTGLAYGYYFVDTSLGSFIGVNSANKDASIREKNTSPSLDKEIASTTSGVVGDDPTKVGETDTGKNEAATAQVGDTITYKLTVSAKPGAENYIVTDTLSAGLTPPAETNVTVTGLTVTDDYTVSVSGQVITVTFTKAYLDTITEDTSIVINYTAILNTNAVVGEGGNKNEAKLTWGNNPDVNYSVDDAKVYTAKITVVKNDGNSAGLAGAEFVLKNASGKYYKYNASAVAATDAQGTEGEDGYVPATAAQPAGVIWVDSVDDATVFTSGGDDGKLNGEFTGLTNGSYTLEEIKAPDGYNEIAPDDASLQFAITDSDYSDTNLIQSTTVINNAGTVLPSTGGIGTTIFYVVGSVLVIAAGVLLVTKKRMGRD